MRTSVCDKNLGFNFSPTRVGLSSLSLTSWSLRDTTNMFRSAGVMRLLARAAPTLRHIYSHGVGVCLSVPLPILNFDLDLLLHDLTDHNDSDDVCTLRNPHTHFAEPCLLFLRHTPDQGRCPRCWWRYRPAPLSAAQAQPGRHLAQSLRYPRSTRCRRRRQPH